MYSGKNALSLLVCPGFFSPERVGKFKLNNSFLRMKSYKNKEETPSSNGVV
jgi:hypothetical protein